MICLYEISLIQQAEGAAPWPQGLLFDTLGATAMARLHSMAKDQPRAGLLQATYRLTLPIEPDEIAGPIGYSLGVIDALGAQPCSKADKPEILIRDLGPEQRARIWAKIERGLKAKGVSDE